MSAGPRIPLPRFPEGGGRPRPVGLQPVSNSSTETSRARGNRDSGKGEETKGER